MAKKYRCPIIDIVNEKDIAKYSQKQLWYMKRDYCLNECEHECDILVMLKKIYWELRKQNEIH